MDVKAENNQPTKKNTQLGLKVKFSKLEEQKLHRNNNNNKNKS